MELSDQEIEFLYFLLQEVASDMYHHPGDFTEEEHEAHSVLSPKIHEEAKKRGFWWAK